MFLLKQKLQENTFTVLDFEKKKSKTKKYLKQKNI